jgi:DNA-binding PadR family transcriptional regulator
MKSVLLLLMLTTYGTAQASSGCFWELERWFWWAKPKYGGEDPSLSYRQYVVLSATTFKEEPGYDIRQRLEAWYYRRLASPNAPSDFRDKNVFIFSGPAFYSVLLQLEKDKLVDARDGYITIGGKRYSQRIVNINSRGRAKLEFSMHPHLGIFDDDTEQPASIDQGG